MEQFKSKTTQRIVSVFLVVLMLFSMMPVNVFAENLDETTTETSTAVEESTTVESTTTIQESTTAESTTVQESTTAESTTVQESTTNANITTEKVEAIVEDSSTTVSDEITTRAEDDTTTTKTDETTTQFPTTYRVSVSKNEGGTVTLNGAEVSEVTANEGESVYVLVTPSEGYYISEINGNTPSNTNKYETTINNESELNVVFSKKTYEVTVVVGENGEVKYNSQTVNNKFTIEYGDAPEFLIVANKGYVLATIEYNNQKVLFDSASVSETINGVVYKTPEIKANVKVEITFEEKKVISVDDITNNEYFSVSFSKDPIDIVEQNGVKTIILPKDGKATFTPKGNYHYIRVNGGELKRSVDFIGKLNKIKVSVGTLEWINKEFNLNCLIAVDDKVEPAQISLPSGKYYSSDVKGIKVSVPEDQLSGIKDVVYTLSVGGETTETKSLVDAEENPLKFNSETGMYETTVDVLASAVNQKKDVKIVVTVEDKAGNKSKPAEEILVVNTVAPDVSISIDGAIDGNATLSNHYKGNNKGDVVRTATITITDWEETFDKNNAIACLAVNSYKSSTDKTAITDENFAEPDISDWNSNGNIHTCTVKFIDDAYYEWSFGNYVNKAGLSDDKIVEEADDGKEENIYSFTCDTTTPDATFNVGSKLAELWNNTFGVFKNIDLTVSVEDVSDNLSEPCEVLYYKLEDANNNIGLTKTTLEELYKNNKFVTDEYSFSKENPDAFVIYARVADAAGNVKYMSSDGIVIDTTAVGIKADFEIKPNSYDYFNDDVTIKIESIIENAQYQNSLEEALENLDIYSGIKSIYYVVDVLDDIYSDNPTVIKSGNPTNLYSFNVSNPTYGQLVTKLEEGSSGFENKIVISKDEFNCDNIRVTIFVVDNAGNVNDEKEFKFHINSDKPEIKIAFDENSPVSGGSRGYFADSRTATVTILDRKSTFLQDNVKIDVTAVGGSKVTETKYDAQGNEYEEEVDLATRYSVDWNGQVATVKFDGNANYIWSVSYVNEAGLSDELNYDSEDADESASGDAPYLFTIDTAKPSGTVSISEKIWSKLLEVITFGLYTNDKYIVTATAEDTISPVNVEYYKTSNSNVVIPESIEDGQWDNFDNWNVDKGEGSIVVNESSEDEQFAFYLRIKDAAGNITYVSSDGAVVDRSSPTIELTAKAPNDNAIYNNDVKINIAVSDVFDYVDEEKTVGINYSGIKSVDYWVGYDINNDGEISDEEKTQSGNLFTYEKSDYIALGSDRSEPVQSELEDIVEKSIVVSSEKNNDCDVIVTVIATDNAGNTSANSTVVCGEKKFEDLDIDITNPLVNVDYDNNNARNEKYFDAERTATVTITERTHHFHTTSVYLNPDDVSSISDGIIVTAVNARGEKVNATLVNENGVIKVADLVDGEALTEMMISKDLWITTEGTTPNDATHATKIKFEADANYTFDVKYVDDADNEFVDAITSESVAPLDFTVDKTAPTGTVIATGKSVVDEKEIDPKVAEWSELLKDFTFGFWSNTSITITETSDDITSPIENVYYYKTTGEEVYDYKDEGSAEEIKDIQSKEIEWKEIGEGFTVKPDEQFVAYLKIVDNAGNTTYISTDGLIVDEKAPIEEVIAPEITIKPEQPINGFYNDDVTVDIKVVDPEHNKSFSGLKSIGYKIYNMGVVTQEGNLYTFDKENPDKKDLLAVWKESDIVVDSKLNNSNDVKIEIIAWDNAMNSSRKSVDIKIDITAPEINIKYDNNSAESGKYYKANRTATIVIKERNFNAEDVMTKITNTDGVIPELSSWKTKAGSSNGDNTTHTAKIVYKADGDYTFDIDYTDLAGNKCKGETFVEGTKNSKEFTLDRTVPTISVSYNNNSAQNGKYFKANRTAMVVINEHNFDVSRVNIAITASLNAAGIRTPGISWSNKGDIHTATISYATDGDYTFDIKMTDMAGNADKGANYGSSVAAKDFTIDTHIETPTITGVENGKSYKEELVPGVKFSDINYSNYSIRLYRTRKDEKNLDVTSKYIRGVAESATGILGSFNSFDITKQENDGLYTLSVEVTDKAGNASSQTVRFTLNRFGSVYSLSDYLISLKEAYVQKIEEKIIITEYNADRLVEKSLNVSITRDGSPVDDVEFTVNPVANNSVAIGESGWYQYDYIIDTSNFTEDGIYKITVSSEDTVGNKPESTNYDDCEILFRVDTTAPEITSIIGLEKAIVNAVSQAVDFEIFDAIGLKSLTIYVNGEILKVFEDFEDLINFKGSETIGEGSNQKIRIVAEDLAGNRTDTDTVNEDGEYAFNPEYAFERDLTVSTNFFVRWFANKGVFFGSILGTLAVVGLVIFVIIKRKKNED